MNRYSKSSHDELIAAFKGKRQGARISFAPERLWEVVTAKR
jgi:hypothetical protein